MSYQEESDILMNSVNLKHQPVAVTLLDGKIPLPDEYRRPKEPMRHCQAIMNSRKGDMIHLPSELHGCKVGSSVLGMNPFPEKAEIGQLHHDMGLFKSMDAAHDAMAQRPMLAVNSTVGSIYSPLSKSLITPDVIIITATPEQVSWLYTTASAFEDGTRMTPNMGSVLASCGDSTVIPYITGKPNVSFGCFGCRKSTDIASEEMLLGIPMSKLSNIVDALSELGQGAIPRSRSK